jgi:DNA-binding beta-propeller fold protein YncE
MRRIPARPAVLARTTVALWLFGAAALAGADPIRFTLEAASAQSLGQPHDIVLSPDGTKLYVADNGRDRIVVLDPASLAELGVFARGEVRQPHDVVFDREGRLLVADTGNSRIAIYAVSGSSGRLVGELKGSIVRPEGVDVHPDGRVIATGAASGNVAVFRDGEEIAQTGGLAAPHDVQVDARGRIWLADTGHDRIVRVDDALATVQVIAGTRYAFNGPRYLDFDDHGRLFVADKYANQIKIIAPDGTLLQVLGSERAGLGEGVFDRPEGVEIRGDTVWFSDTYNDRIVRYRMRGAD